jgi:hypothetical protein
VSTAGLDPDRSGNIGANCAADTADAKRPRYGEYRSSKSTSGTARPHHSVAPGVTDDRLNSGVRSTGATFMSLVATPSRRRVMNGASATNHLELQQARQLSWTRTIRAARSILLMTTMGVRPNASLLNTKGGMGPSNPSTTSSAIDHAKDAFTSPPVGVPGVSTMLIWSRPPNGVLLARIDSPRRVVRIITRPTWLSSEGTGLAGILSTASSSHGHADDGDVANLHSLQV